MAKKRPTFLQAFTIIGCGVLMAFFGCLGMVAVNAGEGAAWKLAIAVPLAIVGLAGLVTFAVGGLRLLFVTIRTVVNIVRGVPPDSVDGTHAPPTPVDPSASPPDPHHPDVE